MGEIEERVIALIGNELGKSSAGLEGQVFGPEEMLRALTDDTRIVSAPQEPSAIRQMSRLRLVMDDCS